MKGLVGSVSSEFGDAAGLDQTLHQDGETSWGDNNKVTSPFKTWEKRLHFNVIKFWQRCDNKVNIAFQELFFG